MTLPRFRYPLHNLTHLFSFSKKFSICGAELELREATKVREVKEKKKKEEGTETKLRSVRRKKQREERRKRKEAREKRQKNHGVSLNQEKTWNPPRER